jgi:hypothetical protein
MREGDAEFSSNVNKTTTTTKTKIILIAKVNIFEAPVK